MRKRKIEVFIALIIVLPLTTYMLLYRSKKITTENPKTVLLSRQLSVDPTRQTPLNLEKWLNFLNPDISKCKGIFEMGSNGSEFQHIWDALHEYQQQELDPLREQFPKKGKNKCMEGHSSQYREEVFIMAKLAR